MDFLYNHFLVLMQTLAFFLLLAGAAVTVILVPTVLFMSGTVFDAPSAGGHIKNYLVLAAMIGLAAACGWCVYQGWQQYQKAAFDTALKYALYPALLALVGVVFVVKSLVSTAIEGRRLNDESQRIDADSVHSMNTNAPKSLPNQSPESSDSVAHAPAKPQQ
jgi:hypothetical protein